MPDRNSYQQIRELQKNRMAYVPLGDSPVEELELKYKGQEDLDELRFILGRIFTYPSTELAQLHRDANRLGSYDIKDDEHVEKKLEAFDQYRQIDTFCPDCGFVRQLHKIPVCTSIREVNNVGVSIFLYFHTLVGLSIILLVGFLMYGIYALITNIMAANQYRSFSQFQDVGGLYDSFSGVLVLSLGSKQTGQQFAKVNRIYFLIQCWIGVGMVVIWGLLFLLIKYRQQKGVSEVVKDIKSVADFSISIENIPEDMTEQQLERQLTQYQKQILEDYPDAFTDTQIMHINLAKPFYLEEKVLKKEEIQEVNKRYNKLMKKFISWIQERRKSTEFSVSARQRLSAYKQYEKTKEQQEILLKEVTEDIKKSFTEKRGNKTVAFVTLRSTYTQQCLLRKNEEDLSSSVRETLFFCCKKKRKFMLTDSNGNQVQTYLKQAPEPEDIIWTNLGQSKRRIILVKVFTFFITFLILGGSFAAVYALSKIRVELEKKSGTTEYYYSFLISIVIPIFNIIIQQVFKLLSRIERNYTTTMTQASIAVKGTFASLINSILVPILVNYYFKQKNLYGVNGLSYDVFLLGITNSFFPALIRIFDIYFWLTRFVQWIVTRPSIKLKLCQNRVNFFSEYMEFEPGYDMIPIVNSFLFTCFFVALQPIIMVFAFLGMVLMFWTQKYSLYNRCKRPAPGNRSINTAMYSLILLGPLFYAMGSFCWSHFFNQKIEIPMTANLLASILAFIVFIFPYSLIILKCRGKEETKEMFYENNKIFFPSEYDRMNPATSENAVKEYIQFVADYKKQLKKKGAKEIAQIERQFLKQMRRGKYAKKDQYLNRLGEAVGDMAQIQESKLLDNWFAGEYKQNNAHILGSTIFGDDIPPTVRSLKKFNKNQNIQLPIQNWATSQEINRLKSKMEDYYEDSETHTLISYKNWKPKVSQERKMQESPNGFLNKGDSEIQQTKKPTRKNGPGLHSQKSGVNEINSITNISYKNIFHPTNPFAINYSGINSFVEDEEPRRNERPIFQKSALEYIFGSADKRQSEIEMRKSHRDEEKDKRNKPPIFQEDSEQSK